MKKKGGGEFTCGIEQRWYNLNQPQEAISKLSTVGVPPNFGGFCKRLFGQMADELLLRGVRAAPRVLEEAGYEFQHPQLEGTLRDILQR